jgi:hypothetical protein
MKLFLILGVALLAIPACESSEEDGTESHFLEHCTESSQCGELTCIAQRCTRECDSDADCSSLGISTYCRQDAGVSRCGVTGDGEAGASAGGRTTTTGGVAGAPGSGGTGGSGPLGTGGSLEAGRSAGGAGQTGGAPPANAGASGADGGQTADAGAVNAPGGDAGDAGAAGSAATELIACADPAPRLVAGEDTGFVQCGPTGAAYDPDAPQFEAVVLHRASALECPNLLPRADGGECTSNDLSDPAEPCAEDADCSARPFGFCSLVPTAHYPSCGCSYGCIADSDCEPGQICECGDPVGLCRAASCSVDAECGSGNLCASAPLATTSCTFFPAPRGYECQAPADQCLSDADCAAQAGTVCTFSSITGSRTCERGPAPCP